MKKKYYLGVDIGGTKSHALLADDHGIVIGFGAAGPGNHEVVGYEGLRGVLHEITQHALDTSGILKEDIQGAGFGIGGYDWPSEREPTMEAINTLQLNTQYEIVNDTIIGLIAGAPRGWGVALVAGTGSNCWGWDQDHNIGRVTGNGPEFGECCGASDLVPKAVQAISAQWSMRGPETDLSKAFIDLVKARDITDLLEGLTLGWYRLDSNAALTVFEIAKSGDHVAREMIQQSGRELGDLACGVIRQLSLEDEDFDLVMIGSLFDGGSLITEPMKENVLSIAPKVNFVRLDVPPVIGGVLLGMQKVGIEPLPYRKALIDSISPFNL